MMDTVETIKDKTSRPIKFGELELILIRYNLMLQEDPIKYTTAEFILQEHYRRNLFK